MPRAKTFDPDRALQAMTQVFWEKGYHATSVSDLERVTRLNKRSLYNAFGNKEAIFDAVLRGYIEDASAMREVLRREPPGLNNVKSFFAQIKNPDSRGCLLTKTIHQNMLVSADARRMVRASLVELEGLFVSNLAGSVESIRDARRLARFLSSSYQGISTMSAVDPSRARLRHVVTSIHRLLESEVRHSRAPV